MKAPLIVAIATNTHVRISRRQERISADMIAQSLSILICSLPYFNRLVPLRSRGDLGGVNTPRAHVG